MNTTHLRQIIREEIKSIFKEDTKSDLKTQIDDEVFGGDEDWHTDKPLILTKKEVKAIKTILDNSNLDEIERQAFIENYRLEKIIKENNNTMDTLDLQKRAGIKPQDKIANLITALKNTNTYDLETSITEYLEELYKTEGFGVATDKMVAIQRGLEQARDQFDKAQ